MMNFVIAASMLVTLASAQTCPPAGSSGLPCANGNCPAGQTCIDLGQITEECCNNAFLPTTLAPTTVAATGTTVAVTGTTVAGQTIITTRTTGTTVSSTCRDLLNPRTGISDCPARASLCNDSTYYDVMTRQCPRTCNRCSTNSTTSASTTCANRLNPRTGVSDCPARASLCNDSTYYDIMTVQCPRTCNRCTGTGTSSGTTVSGATTTASSTCVDQINPATGVSDCPSRAYLCNNSAYLTLMTQQCPRTCGRCTSG